MVQLYSRRGVVNRLAGLKYKPIKKNIPATKWGVWIIWTTILLIVLLML